MPNFLTLEDYDTPQKMRKIQACHQVESTVPSDLADLCLTGFMEARLKVAWLAADALKKGGLKTHDNRPPANLSIRERAKFFEENTPQKMMEKQRALNNRVIHYRKWLSRQGAWFKNDYEIDHSRLKNKLVKYDHELSRQGITKVKVMGDKIYTHDNQLLDTEKMVTHHSGPGYAIYVLSGDGNFHVASHKVGQYHHSSLLAGGRVACAGEMKVTNGVLKLLSNKSGHYQPDNDDLLHALAILQKNGNSMQFAVNRLKAGNQVDRYPSVDAFITSIGQDNKTVLEAREALKAASAGYATTDFNVSGGGYLTEEFEFY